MTETSPSPSMEKEKVSTETSMDGDSSKVSSPKEDSTSSEQPLSLKEQIELNIVNARNLRTSGENLPIKDITFSPAFSEPRWFKDKEHEEKIRQ